MRRQRYRWAGLLSFERPLVQEADSIPRGGRQHDNPVKREWLGVTWHSRRDRCDGVPLELPAFLMLLDHSTRPRRIICPPPDRGGAAILEVEPIVQSDDLQA